MFNPHSILKKNLLVDDSVDNIPSPVQVSHSPWNNWRANWLRSVKRKQMLWSMSSDQFSKKMIPRCSRNMSFTSYTKKWCHKRTLDQKLSSAKNILAFGPSFLVVDDNTFNVDVLVTLIETVESSANIDKAFSGD